MTNEAIRWTDTRFYGLDNKITDEQREFLNAIQDYQLVICNSKSGTGKTTLSVAMAKLLNKGLVYMFSPVEEDVLGYRPGTLKEKESNYLYALQDALIEIGDQIGDAIILDGYSKSSKSWVIAKSHTFDRGINIKDTTVIIDEAQNWTIPELRKVLTRIHDDCKVIVIGHTGQIDLDDANKSGFRRCIEHFRDKDYCKIVNLTTNFRGRLSTDADEL